ncbi:class I SAM-dependent methyltransferase [Anaeromyxobacter diazotrophicus]|uniref:Methyltransferase n=1 Tax=Anaeromyxobacter diazotrophicus TaxID=2590199 RepID=A0A7I9VLR0_9BACT|nr:class I SAM-dependent methyltransferase [Anaeromyxobacter diazotrophicus]GEJ57138.1 methyltransferase [Anaeromyxobacter diazotrophicus]
MSEFDAKARTWDDDPQKAERARCVADAIAARVPDLARRRALEYGSGTGLLGFALRGRVAALTLADSSSEMTRVAREKIAALGARDVTAVQLDLTTGPAPGEVYDLVCTLLTLHHVPDVPALLRRFHALVAPAGYVCVADLDEEDGSFHGAGFEGHRGFRREVMASWLAEAGFSAIELQGVFEIERPGPGGIRRYPVFLAVGRRAA